VFQHPPQIVLRGRQIGQHLIAYAVARPIDAHNARLRVIERSGVNHTIAVTVDIKAARRAYMPIIAMRIQCSDAKALQHPQFCAAEPLPAVAASQAQPYLVGVYANAPAVGFRLLGTLRRPYIRAGSLPCTCDRQRSKNSESKPSHEILCGFFASLLHAEVVGASAQRSATPKSAMGREPTSPQWKSRLLNNRPDTFCRTRGAGAPGSSRRVDRWAERSVKPSATMWMTFSAR